MYVQTDPTRPSPKAAEFEFLRIWAHNELIKRRDHYNPGWALVGRGSRKFSEQGLKCERPDGQVYFLFPPSVLVEEADTIEWGKGSGPDDEWVVASTNRVKEYVRCEVRRPKKTDLVIEDLLRSASFTEAAEYLSNAKQRLGETTSASWGDCVSNCRNALQSTIRQMTGEGQLSAGRDVLSKSGAHPPLPDYHFAVFAFEQTAAILRFLVSTHLGQR